jgi:hypothetical protein
LKLRGGRYYEAVEAAASTGASGNKARNDIQKNRLSGPRQSPRLLLQQNLPEAEVIKRTSPGFFEECLLWP